MGFRRINRYFGRKNMKIYKLSVVNKTLEVHPIDDYYENPKYDSMQKGSKKKYFNEKFHYKLLAEKEWCHEYREKCPKGCTFANVVKGSNLFFDEKALKLFEPLFDETIEVFPSASDIKKYFFINIMEGLENSWDRTQTKYKVLREEPLVIQKFLTSIHFYKNIVEGKHIFRINEDYPVIYVSDTFKEIYDENKLTGITFKLVWDSEGLPDDFEMNPVLEKNKLKR